MPKHKTVEHSPSGGHLHRVEEEGAQTVALQVPQRAQARGVVRHRRRRHRHGAPHMDTGPVLSILCPQQQGRLPLSMQGSIIRGYWSCSITKSVSPSNTHTAPAKYRVTTVVIDFFLLTLLWFLHFVANTACEVAKWTEIS